MRSCPLALLLASALPASGWVASRCVPRSSLAGAGAPLRQLRLCAPEEEPEAVASSGGGDWREMRARLVAQERAAQAQGEDAADELVGFDEAGDGFVYESPLIEQGSVILGGTMQEFGFALRQQYFRISAATRTLVFPPGLD